MEELQYTFWTALLLLLTGGDPARLDPPTAPDLAGAYIAEQVQMGDSWGVSFNIERAYEAAGISINDTLTWQFLPYDRIVNWYDPYDQVIHLAEMPADDQVTAYWDNWSRVLTGGNWDWRGFFADADEAREMARFNQFLLGAHEYGHALTYRFDPGHVARVDDEINCRELAADRLAAGLLEELAATEPRFARWRNRYGELAAAINGEIDAALRYDVVDYPALDADCRLMHVVQPDEDSMTPYASAYFARWQALLATDLPPLPALYETYLFSHWRAAQVPGAPLAESVEYVDWIYADLTGSYERDGRTFWRLPGFAPDGRLFVMDYALVQGDDTVSLALLYGPPQGKKKPVTEDLVLDLEGAAFFDLTAVLPLGPDRFLAASSDIWGDADNVVLLDFRRSAAGWNHRVVRPLPGVQNAETRLSHAGPGSARLDLYQFGTDGPSHWLLYRLDLESLAVTPLGQQPDRPYAYAGQLPDGREVLVDSDDPMVLLADGDAAPIRIAGNGLQGFKDAYDPLAVEFAMIEAVTVLGKTIRLLDYDPIARQFSVRDVILK